MTTSRIPWPNISIFSSPSAPTSKAAERIRRRWFLDESRALKRNWKQSTVTFDLTWRIRLVWSWQAVDWVWLERFREDEDCDLNDWRRMGVEWARSDSNSRRKRKKKIREVWKVSRNVSLMLAHLSCRPPQASSIVWIYDSPYSPFSSRKGPEFSIDSKSPSSFETIACRPPWRWLLQARREVSEDFKPYG